MKTKATIYGTPEQIQNANIEFELYKVGKWFGNDCFVYVNSCKVIEPLLFTPSYLQDDLEIAIAKALRCSPNDIRMDCDAEYSVRPARKIITDKKLELHTLFI